MSNQTMPSKKSGNRPTTTFLSVFSVAAVFVIAIGKFQSTENAAQPAVKAELPPTAVYWNKTPLSPNTYGPLPLGSIKPRGWLKRQLEIQASGLSGHVDEFWPDLKNSGWIGGTGESWERAPYFLDGLVPLAYTLGDQRLIEKAKKWVDWTIQHQRADGRIGPELGKGKYATTWQESDEWWPNMIMLKVLAQYQEATGDPRVIPLMDKYFDYQIKLLDK